MSRLARTSRPRHAGFTLLELMIVVVIVAVTAALAAPAMITAFAEHRANEAAIDLVRLGRRARSEAIAYNRAHLIRFANNSTPGTNGEAFLYRGVAGGCNQNNWVSILASPACGVVGSMCLDVTNMGDNHWQVGNNVTQIRAPGYNGIDICYQPNGVVMMRYGAGLAGSFFEGNTMGGGIVFTVQRLRGGAPDGVTRRVIFPLGTTPRVLL